MAYRDRILYSGAANLLRSTACHPHAATVSAAACAKSLPALCAAGQIVVFCVLTQMNYLNKALDLFNTAIVSPIYYVMFTTLTVAANIILFQVSFALSSATAAFAPMDSAPTFASIHCSCRRSTSPSELLAALQEVQSWTQIMTEGCGFVTIVIGTFLLHATRDIDASLGSLSHLARARPRDSDGNGGVSQQDRLPLVTTLPRNYSGVQMNKYSN